MNPAELDQTRTALPVPDAWPRGLDFFRFLIVLGEATAVAAVLVHPGLASSLPSDGVLVVAALAGVFGAGLALGVRRPWALLAGSVLVSLLPLLASSRFVVPFLLDPLSGRRFFGACLLLFGLVVAVPAGLRGFRRQRADTHTPIPRGWRSRHGTFVITAAALVLGASYAGGIASVTVSRPLAGHADFAAADIGASSINLTMRDLRFDPQRLDLVADQITEIVIMNPEDESHTFTYVKQGREYHHNLLGRSTVKVFVLFPEAGEFSFRCTPHSRDYTEGMVGTLRVAAP